MSDRRKKDKIFEMKPRKKKTEGVEQEYRCVVMTMTARVELIATWSSNPASSSVMLAPTKPHQHHQRTKLSSLDVFVLFSQIKNRFLLR